MYRCLNIKLQATEIVNTGLYNYVKSFHDRLGFLDIWRGGGGGEMTYIDLPILSNNALQSSYTWKTTHFKNKSWYPFCNKHDLCNNGFKPGILIYLPGKGFTFCGKCLKLT